MTWVITWPGMFAIPAVVTILVLLVHGPQVRANYRRRETEERLAREAATGAQDQPKKTSASA